MVRAWSIARTELLRMLRDRANLFFVFVFPLLLVALIGAQFGGDSFDLRVGVVGPAGDPAVEAFRADLDEVEGVVTAAYEDGEDLRSEVSRGLLVGGVVLPEDYDEALRTVTPAVVDFVGRPDGTGQSLGTMVGAVIRAQAAPGQAAVIAADALDADPAALREIAIDLQSQVAGVDVVTEQLGVDELGEQFAGLGQFDLGASSQLFLFTFLTALSGGVALIQTRQFGVARRMLSTSTPMRIIILGFSAGRFLIAATQAIYIVVASLLLFQVDWGDPLATGAIVLMFCLVAAAAGLLVGATFSNDSQAGGVAVGAGLGLAALGGSMVPLELFPDGVRSVGRLTPHSWANEAMAEIVRRDGTLVDVLPQLGVLATMAVVILAFATWQLQRTLTR